MRIDKNTTFEYSESKIIADVDYMYGIQGRPVYIFGLCILERFGALFLIILSEMSSISFL